MTTKQAFNTSAELDYPKVLPTLDLDFANSKTLDPRITFTRASGGSYVGADGLIKYAGVNEPRFDHDPETGESLGLLIEEQRTNLLIGSDYSTNNAFSNLTLTLNATTAPDGTNTAVSLDGANSNSNLKFMYKGHSTNTTGTYTTSIFMKYKSERFVILRMNDNGGVNGVLQRIDILNGILINTVESGGTVTNVSSSIIPYPNGWYRISVTGTFNSALTQVQGAQVWLTTYGNTTTTNGVYLWGPQLEVGSFPTSYIPTQASTRTRASDTAQITGKNFSDFFNKNEGTTLITYRPRFNGIYQSPFTSIFVINSSNISGSKLGLTGNVNDFQLYLANTNQTNIALTSGFTWLSPPTPSSRRTERVVLSYGEDYIRMYQNSNTFLSTNSTYGFGKIEDLIKTVFKISNLDFTRLLLGGDPGSTFRFNYTIQNFRYYPKDLEPQTLKNISQIYH